MRWIPINPATGRPAAGVHEHSMKAVEAILSRTSIAQPSWAALPLARRARRLRALGRELRAASDVLATLAAREMGKPVTQGRAEVEKCATLCDHFARHATSLLTPEHPAGCPPRARIVHEPLGTILAIMPWNFPYWQVVRAAVPALLAGNAVLLKPAPNTPGCARALERLFDRAGFPPGTLRSLLVGTDVVPALIADERIHGVTLTGSGKAGRTVAAFAGAAMKPGVFELGGSDPMIVLRDADLARAAELGAQSRLLNSGQSCICAKRFIVEKCVQKTFEKLLVERLAARRIGNPLDPATDVGPLAREDLRAKLHRQVRQSVRKGARLLLGGHPLPGPGWYYAPTALTHVGPGMAVYAEETFGPVAAIIPVRDAAEAVRVANDTPFGLGASIFTHSRRKARALASSLKTGSVFINDFVRSVPELPFGGVKDSGYGRELGPWGARAFVNVKTVWTA